MIIKGKVNTGYYEYYHIRTTCKHGNYWEFEFKMLVPKSIKVVLATINEVKTSKPFKLRALLSWLVHASR